MDHDMTRRQFMHTAAAAIPAFSALRVFAEDEDRDFKISACDWSIGKMQTTEALELAKDIGLDGVQVSFSKPGGDFDLREKSAREKYEKVSESTSVAISSLAMGVLNSEPYSTSDDAEKWVEQCIDVAKEMKQQVILLAFFGKGDINDNRELQDKVIAKLKKVTPKAEEAGVILGLETWLNKDDHLYILDSVDSPAVQVYYDTANMEKMGYDIYQEIRDLGKQRICEIHCKENGHLLGEGRVDFKKVKEAIEEIEYDGWLVIESATVRGKSVKDCYKHNNAYLRKVFNDE